MNLIDANYNSKNILLLEIGQSDTKLFALDASKLDTSDRDLIKKYKDELNKLSSDQLYAWLKSNCVSIASCYRTYTISKLKINKIHTL